ncbi:unnamed protein product [Periconia digitata]|uniref:BZIP domain-containing protein n=1 Tax=Periconia digitata TaxID=1303443 RepID=A0A9W4UAD9_9PLEO|nr:unnamed protein product [Periconia digitata]
METLTHVPHYQPDLNMAMTSDMPNLFGSPNEWGNASHSFTKRPNANYLELSIPELHNQRRGPPQRHGINDARIARASIDASMPTYDGFTHGGELNQSPEAQQFNGHDIYASQTGFTALNTPSAELSTHNRTDTISPLQTRFEPSFNSSPGFSTDTGLHSATSSTFGSISGPNALEQSSIKRRRHNTWTGEATPSSPPPTAKPTGRRRQSENVEPGSARAIYLEKNRKAASKCRGKQRMQQQELVETARDMERKNKQLKAEVEFLKSDMRDLMMIVGRHSDCPDGRLKMYVQREADRLISRDAAPPAVTAPSAPSEMAPSQNSNDGHPPSE